MSCSFIFSVKYLILFFCTKYYYFPMNTCNLACTLYKQICEKVFNKFIIKKTRFRLYIYLCGLMCTLNQTQIISANVPQNSLWRYYGDLNFTSIFDASEFYSKLNGNPYRIICITNISVRITSTEFLTFFFLECDIYPIITLAYMFGTIDV